MWPWLAGGGAASLGTFGVGYVLGARRWRRHHDEPDRVYRIVVVDETDRGGGSAG